MYFHATVAHVGGWPNCDTSHQAAKPRIFLANHRTDVTELWISVDTGSTMYSASLCRVGRGTSPMLVALRLLRA